MAREPYGAVWQDPPIDVPIKYHGLLYVEPFTFLASGEA